MKVQEKNVLSDDNQLTKKAKHGMFIFPVLLLQEKGIISSLKNKGKTAFRIFPPWSQDRGEKATQVFSTSGKKTQRWQLPFFIEITTDGLINSEQLNSLFNTV